MATTGIVRGQAHLAGGRSPPGRGVTLKPSGGEHARVVDSDAGGAFELADVPAGGGDARRDVKGFVGATREEN